MKDKIFMLVIGILIGAIITSAGFLIFDGNKGRRDFDQNKFKDGDMTPPSFSRNKEDHNSKKDDMKKTDINTVSENQAE